MRRHLRMLLCMCALAVAMVSGGQNVKWQGPLQGEEERHDIRHCQEIQYHHRRTSERQSRHEEV